MNNTAPEFRPRPEYVGITPRTYKNYILGLERITAVWSELIPLGAQEWAEVGDDKRIGPLEPDYIGCMQRERKGRMGVVTVRRLGTFELVGYFVGVLGTPLKTRGKIMMTEVAVYLIPDVRDGWLFRRLLEMTEEFAKAFGADALVVAHRPEHARIGTVYKRAGFEPVTVDYVKRFDSDNLHD